MGLADLTWTRRAEVAAELLDYLQGTHPLAPRPGRSAQEPPRSRVAELLALVATAAHRNGLLALALDSREALEVRRSAIWGLERISAAISGEDLQAFLADPLLCRHGQTSFSRADVLALARSPSSQAVAQEHLLKLQPWERAHLLAGSSDREADAPQNLIEWLYRQWLEHDRHLMAENLDRRSLNRQVIRRTLARTESRRVLQELWRGASGPARLDLLTDLEDDEYEWTFPEPLTEAEREELAGALALPSPALAAHFGRRGLIARLEQTLNAEHHALSSSVTGRRKVSAEAASRLRVLRHWQDPEVEEWIAGHALGKRLHRKLRRHLLWLLWCRNRPLASTTLAVALQARDYELVRPFLRWVAHDPREADRELLREAFQEHQLVEIRYLGLCGLDRLDRTREAPWCAELQELARTENLSVRLLLWVWGAQARRGDSAARTHLEQYARNGPEQGLRAEAVGILGEVCPGESLALLEDTLEREERALQMTCVPAAEEAALALARLATPEARTLLLRAYLRSETWSLRHALADYVAAVVDTPEGMTPQVDFPHMHWRRILRWDWE